MKQNQPTNQLNQIYSFQKLIIQAVIKPQIIITI